MIAKIARVAITTTLLLLIATISAPVPCYVQIPAELPNRPFILSLPDTELIPETPIEIIQVSTRPLKTFEPIKASEMLKATQSIKPDKMSLSSRVINRGPGSSLPVQQAGIQGKKMINKSMAYEQCMRKAFDDLYERVNAELENVPKRNQPKSFLTSE